MTRLNELAFSDANFLAAAERVAATRESAPAVTAMAAFLDQYRNDAYAEDFLALSTEDAALLAIELWELNLAAQPHGAREISIRRAKGFGGKSLKLDVVDIVGADMAFLVDSTIGVLQDARLEIRAVLHPVINSAHGPRSLIQIHLPPLEPAQRADLKRRLEIALAEVAEVNADFLSLRDRMRSCAEAIDRLKPRPEIALDDLREYRDFLLWLVDDKFTFLGAREYTFPRTPDGALAEEEPILDIPSGLGILRDPQRRILKRGDETTLITPRISAFLREPAPIIVSKASFVSQVHRRVHADYIGVKRYDASGAVIGETRFVGLLTSDAYTRATNDVPLIRRKLSRLKQAYFATESRFSMKRLENVLETLPRDELFQIDEADLARIASGLLKLQTRPRTQLFIRRDRFDRFVSALLYTPRENFNSQLRERAHRMLAEAYGGRMSAFYPTLGDNHLARVHFIIGVDRGHPEPDEDLLDLQMRQLFETWEESVGRAARAGGLDASLISRATFSAAYKEAFSGEEALADLNVIAAMPSGGEIKVRAWGSDLQPGAARCKIYHNDSALPLSQIVPVLERMGLNTLAEFAYPVRFTDDGGAERQVFVHDLTIERPPTSRRLDHTFEEAFHAIWSGSTENDRFNRIVTTLGVDWRSAALLRTLCRYRAQTGLDPSEAVQVAALCDHSDITSDILKVFASKFDPGLPGDAEARSGLVAPLLAALNRKLEAVTSLDADRVLRRLVALVTACTRTNFYQLTADGSPPRHIVIKIASKAADPLPAPRPDREFFVWSPEVEGVHLRFGPVARGGLRWSDRRDDFRTEVLGLVKAQQVKNAVIVPVGAKGGFFPKKLPVGGSRDEIQAEGVAAYRTFIGALLDLTDNIVKGRTVRPERVVCWDDEDPYLVVAADKGTATFSDIANGVSAERGFWLGDAFASGGSVGFDHKKMGITARGAWVAVDRHFRELGVNVQTDPFRVIGVGDMSGDVFGNAMLRSGAIRLIAAFDHRHIFIDPNPEDLEAAFNERQRLFDLPRSTWADYDKSLLSRGGGVFERSAKSIPLNYDIGALTGLPADGTATPDQLIKALLAAETDLLWFGGIGTYVKASTQAHSDVGDKTNDGVRVDAADVRARVIGEGANLGVTQAARIEFARKGGRINSDAIDNSAGVDTSDHEVNIKIMLSDAIAAGAVAANQRDALLADMTDDVAALVLRNNYDQTGALSLMQASAAEDLDSHERLMEVLEARGKLDREVEGLPGAEGIRRLREAGLGLTRPELAILLAYAKIDLFNLLIAGDAPDDPAFESLLAAYFPPALRDMPEAMARHRLRREIISTSLANRVVNVVGPAYVYYKQEAEGVDAGRVVQAVEAAYAVFHFDDLMDRIEALDQKIPADAQLLMMSETASNLRLLAGAFTSDAALGGAGGAADIINRYRERIGELRPSLSSALSDLVSSRVEARAERYRAAGAPDDLARDVAMVRALASARETVDIAERFDWPLLSIAFVQHAVGEVLGLDKMRAAARDLEPRDHWDRMALQRVADELPRLQMELTASVVRTAHRDGVPPGMMDRESSLRFVRGWAAPRQDLLNRLADPMRAFDRSGWSLAKLVLLGDALREFVYASRSDIHTDDE
ncbi:NAD-glutamate dehydrogenase [bacterium]|nr:NAD-glutamate dehydrogenase [bacterium]